MPKIYCDVDGTLTKYPGGRQFLGHPYGPNAATSPYQRLTQQILRTLESDGMLVTKNTHSVINQLLRWANVEVPFHCGSDKLEFYLENLTEPSYVLDDSKRLLMTLMLERPYLVIPVHVKFLPQQLHDFLTGRQYQDELLEEYLAKRCQEVDRQPWIRLHQDLQDLRQKHSEITYRVGNKYLTIFHRNQSLDKWEFPSLFYRDEII